MTTTQLVLPQSPSVPALVTERDCDKTHIPAHECARLGICYWCGKPCKVERLSVPHITVPWCGCQTTKTKEE